MSAPKMYPEWFVDLGFALGIALGCWIGSAHPERDALARGVGSALLFVWLLFVAWALRLGGRWVSRRFGGAS